MKRSLPLIFLTLVFMSYLHGEIIEIKSFNEITPHIQQETLVIVDIDDTLLVPVQTLGTDVWFLSRIDHHFQIKKDKLLALDKALAEWEAIRHMTNVKVVEAGADELIHDLQNNQRVMMGLTTQGLALATRTIVQLKSLSIDLSKTAPSLHDHYFMNGKNGVLYRNGILFTSGTSKGEALIKLLDRINYHPKHIVFVDDKKSHLQDVEKSVELRGMSFIGLRYGFSDQRIANYSAEIAEIQWKYSTFDHLLSDEEAALLMKK